MVRISFDDKFKVTFSKIKNKLTKERIIKQIKKIKDNPEIGKPMRNVRKGTRELYVGSFRLSYFYFKDKNEIVLFDFYHKDRQ